MLIRQKVVNLACFDGSHEIEFAPETIIMGPNNAGKSAFISGINGIRPPYFGRGFSWDWPNIYRWRSFENIVHRHDTKRVIEISADIAGNTPDGSSYGGTFGAQLSQGAVALNPQPHLISDTFKRGLGTIWYLAPSRTELPHEMTVGSNPPYSPWPQPINPDGSNAVTFLLERFTSRDRHWETAESWLTKIAPETSLLKSPMRGNLASIETTDATLGTDINLAYQGTGLQKVLAVIAALVFSPPETSIIVEEPEIHLHPRSQEVLVDLFNTAVNEWKKQVIFTTHSWNIFKHYINDLGDNTVARRAPEHPRATPQNCKIFELSRGDAGVKISELNLVGAAFKDTQDHVRKLWG